METLNSLLKIIFVILFLAVSGLIVVPSYRLIGGVTGNEYANRQAPLKPPEPPLGLTLRLIDPKLDIKLQEEQVKAHVQQVAAYAQQVSAYSQQVTAYKSFIETSVKSIELTTYDMVVSKTLVNLLTNFLTTVIGFMLVKAGAGVAVNLMRMKQGQEIQPIELWK